MLGAGFSLMSPCGVTLVLLVGVPERSLPSLRKVTDAEPWKPTLWDCRAEYSVHGRSKCPLGEVVRFKMDEPGLQRISTPPGPGRIMTLLLVTMIACFSVRLGSPTRAGIELSGTTAAT